jgi:indolepyruvate ferredoxin oxidoreductase
MFWVLARMKRLRRSRVNPFGLGDERRDERALIDEYIALVDRLVPLLDGEHRDDAVRIVDLVDSVRGFASVKRRNLDQYRARLAVELAALPLIETNSSKDTSKK